QNILFGLKSAPGPANTQTLCFCSAAPGRPIATHGGRSENALNAILARYRGPAHAQSRPISRRSRRAFRPRRTQLFESQRTLLETTRNEKLVQVGSVSELDKAAHPAERTVIERPYVGSSATPISSTLPATMSSSSRMPSEPSACQYPG